MDSLLYAARHAFRHLVRRPGLTVAIVLILALGIGASTSVFSVVHRVLLRPIPIPELDRLVVAWETDPSQAGSLIEVSLPYFQDWRAESRSFDDLAAFGSVNWSFEFSGPPRRETVPSAAVSASFFDTLRAQPLLGRTFLPVEDEPDAGRVLLLSYALWQRRFSGDATVVGRQVVRGDQLFTIIGVMPKEFDFPQGAQVWIPVAAELEGARRSMPPAAFRGLGVLYVVGRLKTGVSLEAAQSDLAGISRRLSLADGPTEWSAHVIPLVDHHLGAGTRRALEALAVASVFLLLLACANVAVLLVIETIARRSDLAVRQAIGASAGRLALHQLVESFLLAAAGGIAGTLLARWAVQAVVAFGPVELPGLSDVSVDGRALAFALIVTLAAAVLMGLAPAWLASRLAIVPLLKSARGGGGPDRRGWLLSRLLVISEVAVSIVLLVGSGLLVRSLEKLLQVDLGFVPDHTLSFRVGVANEKYPTKGQRLAFHRALLERLRTLPGVKAAGATYLRPLEHGPIGMNSWVLFEGQSLELAAVMANSISVTWQSATPEYLRAIGTRLLEGRDFTEHDTETAPKVAIVSASLARRCWPGESALGKRIHTVDAKAELKGGRLVNVEWQTVVGVVEDARYRGIQNPMLDVYLAETQTQEGVGYFVLRATGDPLVLAPAAREQVRAIDPDAEVGGVTSMAHLVDRALLPWRFSSALLASFAFAALVLTASGLFAVLLHFVSGRTREIAIRMAVGAAPRQVRALVLTQGLGVTALGLALGLTLAAVLARSLSALLYGVGERDPWSYLGGAALLSLVAAAACLLPARRATSVDPITVLRTE